MDLNDLFEKSLRDNQLTFVQLFLDQDFPLNDFFEDHQKLLSLYRMEVREFDAGWGEMGNELLEVSINS